MSTRNKFVYFYSMKICALGFGMLLESFFCLLLVVKWFPGKICRDAWKSDIQLARGQVNTEDEAKFCSPIHPTFEVLVVQHAVGELRIEPFLLTNAGCRHWSSGASHQFTEHTSQIQWFHQDSESCGGSDGQQTTKPWAWPFCWCKFGFGKCLGDSSQSSYWTGHLQLSYTIHFLSPVVIRSRNGSLLYRIGEDNT